MLWALASSAFIIYLYRKLNADKAEDPMENADASGATGLRPNAMGAVSEELAELNERIGALESKLAKV
jgi:hypothetical protein